MTEIPRRSSIIFMALYSHSEYLHILAIFCAYLLSIFVENIVGFRLLCVLFTVEMPDLFSCF